MIREVQDGNHSEFFYLIQPRLKVNLDLIDIFLAHKIDRVPFFLGTSC